MSSFSIACWIVGLVCLGIVILILLPDQQPHRKIVKRWSSYFDLKIVYLNRYSEIFEVDIFDNVMYISRFNKATHDKDEYLYSIAHEFGHLIDYSYREYYNKKEKDPLSARAILRDEQRAWKIAKILLESSNLLDVQKFSNLERRCLLEYKKALRLK